MINGRRFEDVVGIALMGDAVKHVLGLQAHMQLWKTRNAAESRYSRALQYLVDHPLLMGVVSLGEFALGLALAQHAEAAAPESA